jgi:hypothetical protein
LMELCPGKLTGLVGTTDFGNTVTNLPLGLIPAASVTPLRRGCSHSRVPGATFRAVRPSFLRLRVP